eukprot:840829-Prymnesium_polylepis.1
MKRAWGRHAWCGPQSIVRVVGGGWARGAGKRAPGSALSLARQIVAVHGSTEAIPVPSRCWCRCGCSRGRSGEAQTEHVP